MLESTLIRKAIATAQAGSAPSKLAAALDYATSPGGARIRPTILLSVADGLRRRSPRPGGCGCRGAGADPLREPRA
jgi:geranylgeranyl pyrophosphate synthase